MDCFASFAMTGMVDEIHPRHSGVRLLAQAADVQLHMAGFGPP
jgi:hypothetical protein